MFRIIVVEAVLEMESVVLCRHRGGSHMAISQMEGCGGGGGICKGPESKENGCREPGCLVLLLQRARKCASWTVDVE